MAGDQENKSASKWPELRGSSLPDGKRGAWLVENVSAGYVSMLSSDMKRTLRLSVGKFNWYWDEFRKAQNENSPNNGS